jgi:hypothetical protein
VFLPPPLSELSAEYRACSCTTRAADWQLVLSQHSEMLHSVELGRLAQAMGVLVLPA